MAQGKMIGSKSASSDPAKTKQWEGHLRHKELMAEREAERMTRRFGRGKQQREKRKR
jgi:hypothetical protein